MEANKPTPAAAEEDAVLLAIQNLHQIQQDLLKVNDVQQQKLLYMRRNEVIRDLPDFWLNIFMNHPSLQTLIMDEDKEIFHYLDSLNVEDLEDPENGYRITFSFNANPFFENEKLVKTIKFSNQGTLKSTGTTINWKGGFRVLSKRLFHYSIFFSWFITPRKDEWEVEHDLVAEVIKDEIWPDPMADLPLQDDEDGVELEDGTNEDASR